MYVMNAMQDSIGTTLNFSVKLAPLTTATFVNLFMNVRHVLKVIILSTEEKLVKKSTSIAHSMLKSIKESQFMAQHSYIVMNALQMPTLMRKLTNARLAQSSRIA